MSEIISINIPQDYYIRNKKIYNRNEKCYKISNIVNIFDESKFAAWMKEGFANSSAKTQKDLTKAVKSNPATISRLMTGAPQTVNNKPSQPPKDLVIRLAEFFSKDVDEVLMLAGYAPENTKPYPKELVMDYDGFDDDDLKEIAAFIQFRKQRKEAEKQK